MLRLPFHWHPQLQGPYWHRSRLGEQHAPIPILVLFKKINEMVSNDVADVPFVDCGLALVVFHVF